MKVPCECGREDRRVCFILGCDNELIWPDVFVSKAEDEEA